MSNRFGTSALAFWIAWLLAGTVHAGEPFSLDTTPGKLPKTVIPRHYSIYVAPDLEKFTTRGSVTIDIEVLKPVDEIILNALDILATNAVLTVGHREITLKPKTDGAKQTLTLPLTETIKPGKYRLRIEYSGQMTEQAQGLFYVNYPAPSGKKTMIGTQMEPADARRMFPCWDEPAFRASFELTAVLPEKFHAYSNTPIERESSLSSGRKEVRFQRTPSMSSYLLVFVAGELEEISDKVDGVDIRVVTTEGKKEQGRYALHATKELLQYYNNYFGIHYPLPKLDQIAVPGGFDGAMENWGGITYNESVLLFDPTTSSQRTKREIYVTVAHEMAHQWFGNLVTSAWWDDLWLNEGFATWMESKATDHFHPDWQMWLIAAAEKATVMSSDARRSTHAIQQRVENESDANDAFDNITYQKGGAILRMLENYLGEEPFRRGVRRYLNAHRYSNATTADLWIALEKSSGKPVRAISAGWTEQPGLPVVMVSTDSNEGGKTVRLEQERFTVRDPRAESLNWTIPLSVLNLTRSTTNKLLLDDEIKTLTLRDAADVIKVNPGDFGYYRVSYDRATAQKLQGHIRDLSPADRINLFNDSWAMAEAGRNSVSDYLSYAHDLRNETVCAVAEQIITKLSWMDDLLDASPGRAAYRSRCRELLKPQLRRLGWQAHPGEPPDDELLRNDVIFGLAEFEDSSVITEAKSRFEKFLTDPDSLSRELRPAVVRIAGRFADRKIYDQLHELARKATGVEERELYLGAMTGALDPTLAQATLELSLTDEFVPQVATGLVRQVADAGHAALAWKFAQTNITKLLARVDGFARNNYLPGIASAFSDADRAAELLDFVKKNVSEDAAAKAGEAAEKIQFKSDFKRRELPAIEKWTAEPLPD